MNFLAHYLLAESGPSAQYRLGGLFPDLARRAGFRLLPYHLESLEDRYEHLISGIQLHWRADQVFHSSTLFKFAENAWKQALSNQSIGVEKQFFLRHLLAEMWLDRVLLKSNPEKGPDMYQHLDQISRQEILDFSNETVQDKNGKVLHTFEQFMHRKFILAYADAERFSEIGSGVFFHTTFQPPNAELKYQIGNGLNSLSDQEGLLLQHWSNFRQHFE